MRRNKPIPAASAEPWNVEPDAPPTATPGPYDADTTVINPIPPDGYESASAPPESSSSDQSRPGTEFPLSATPPPAQPGHRRNMRGYIIASALVVVVLVIGAIGASVLTGAGDSAPPAAEPSVAAPPPVATAPSDEDCPDATDGPVTTGRDAGGTVGGAEVIKAFEYAYYVKRSGTAARELVAPLGKPNRADQMQAFIDRLDPDTLHCVKITDRGNGLWAVELTELLPRGGEPITYHQLIQTIDANGRTFINSIVKDPDATS